MSTARIPLKPGARFLPSQPPATRFLIAVLGLFIACLLAFAGMLGILARLQMLPPPPFTGTACMDEKFKFLAEHDVRRVDLMAVGSSVTWRNLDVAAFRRTGLAYRPLNAAPCYLHMSETAYLTDFLLRHMYAVRTVVTVVAPRDFEKCTAPREAFFSASLAAAYIFQSMPALPVYFSHFRPQKFIPDIGRIRGMRHAAPGVPPLAMDAYGAGPLRAPSAWLPEPVLSDMCFTALRELEKVVAARDARLVVATIPLQPEWRTRYDPDGRLVAAFEARIDATLQDPSTVFLPGSKGPPEALQHADAVHYVWDSARDYSRHLARRLSAALDDPAVLQADDANGAPVKK